MSLIILVFIIIIIALYMKCTAVVLALAISILFNLVAVHDGKFPASLYNASVVVTGLTNPQQPAAAPPSPVETLHHTEDSYPSDNHTLGYQNWRAYRDTYPTCFDREGDKRTSYPYFDTSTVGANMIDGMSNIDSRNVAIARQRARDKNCTDGWAMKGADYYQYHFNDELEREEQKPWWGNRDF